MLLLLLLVKVSESVESGAQEAIVGGGAAVVVDLMTGRVRGLTRSRSFGRANTQTSTQTNTTQRNTIRHNTTQHNLTRHTTTTAPPPTTIRYRAATEARLPQYQAGLVVVRVLLSKIRKLALSLTHSRGHTTLTLTRPQLVGPGAARKPRLLASLVLVIILHTLCNVLLHCLGSAL